MSKELAAVVVWLIMGYFGTGIRKAQSDLSQPSYNRPGYMRRNAVFGVLFAVFCWPMVWYMIWSTTRRLAQKRTPAMKRQIPVLSSFAIASIVALIIYFTH